MRDPQREADLARVERERDDARTRLDASEARLRALIAAGAQTVYRMSPDWRVMHELDARTLADVSGGIEDWAERYILDDDRPRVFAAIGQAVQGRTAFELEHRVRRADGTVVWVYSRAVPMLDADGAIVEWFGAASDVTERRRVQDALSESEAKYHALLEIIDEGFCVCEKVADDPVDFRYVAANPAFERQTGLTDPVGRTIRELLPGIEASIMAGFDRVARTGRYEAFELRIDALDRWFDVEVAAVGPPGQIVILLRNVTQQRRHEEAEQARLARQAYLLALSDALQPLADPGAIQATAVRLLGEHLGMGRTLYGEFRAEDGQDVLVIEREHRRADLPGLVGRHPADRFGSDVEALRAGRVVRVQDSEASASCDAERAVWRSLGVRGRLGVPLLKGGRLVAVVGVQDASPQPWTDAQVSLLRETAERTWAAVEQSRAEMALRISEAQLRLALGAAKMGTWRWDVTPDRHRRDENLNRLLGLEASASEHSIEAFLAHVLPEDRDRVRDAFAEAVRQGQSFRLDFRVRLPDGQVRWLSDQGDAFGAVDARRLAGACVDITERKWLEEGLREAERRKDEFLAMLGHELRNPLAPLRNVVDTLKRHSLEGPARDRAYAMMDRQIGHLTRLVNDLLDVSRITQGRIELRRESVDLRTVLEAAMDMAAPTIAQRRHEVVLTPPPQPVRISGDPVRLTQVVFNLVNNAAKYTEPGGRIEVDVRRADGHAEIRVRDNGSGMRPELVPRVFDLFTQGQQTLDRAQGGLGVGLTLVRHLVSLHGGSVEARSAGLGLGSEFIVRLPAPWLPDEAPAAEPATPSRVQAPKVDRALVVDDVADIADSYAWLLDGLARDVRTAHSGEQALDLTHRWTPDLVLCDIGMPGMDGLETCRRLRRLPALRHSFFAAVTGYGGDEYLRLAREAGFDTHLVKPVDRAGMESLVRQAARGQGGRP